MSVVKTVNVTSRRWEKLVLGAVGVAAIWSTFQTAPPARGAKAAAPQLPSCSESSAGRLSRKDASHLVSHLPLRFEANQGQTHKKVRFVSRGNGYALFLTPTEAVLKLAMPSKPQPGKQGPPPSAPGSASVLRMSMAGANPNPAVSGVDALAGKSHYLLGRDESKWQRNVANYARVRYTGVYPGVDVVYYGQERELEYDFNVAPGADPTAIRLNYRDAAGRPAPVTVDAAGDLVVQTAAGPVKQHKPVVYQEVDGARLPRTGEYAVQKDGQVGFRIGEYDRSRELVIDPVLTYSSFLGGRFDDEVLGVSSDDFGYIYVTGKTLSTNFPLAAPYQDYLAGQEDAFVTKIDPGGCAIVWSTYLGGGGAGPVAHPLAGPVNANSYGNDRGDGIAVDPNHQVYVAGYTASDDFPVSASGYQTTNSGNGDGWFGELSAAGDTLLYCTCLGGSASGPDEAHAVALDIQGYAYVVGSTSSQDFPTTDNAFQKNYGGGPSDAFFAKFDVNGFGPDSLIYCSYLGGGVTMKSDGSDYGNGIALDSTGGVYLTGTTNSFDFPVKLPIQLTTEGFNAFVTKFQFQQTPAHIGDATLVFSTYLGGNKTDQGNGIAVDSQNNIVVVGTTNSPSFATGTTPLHAFTGGDTDAYVAAINAAGTKLYFLTYLGGKGVDFGSAVAIDGADHVWVTGGIDFSNANPRDPFRSNTGGDAFLTELGLPDPSVVPGPHAPVRKVGVLYTRRLGGKHDDYGSSLHLDGFGSVYVVGATDSFDFTKGTATPFQKHLAGDRDGFVAKFAVSPKVGRISVSPSKLDFKSENGGPVKASFTVKNTGKAPMAVTISDPTGQFVILSGGGQFILQPGAKRVVTVKFTPDGGRNHYGGISINSTSAGTKGCLRVALHGKIK